MSKQDELFNKIKNKRTAASTFRESMDQEATSQNKNTSVSENQSKNGSVNVSEMVSVNEDVNKSENSIVYGIDNRIGIGNIDVSKIASKRPKKPKFEELHKKDNVWIKNELHAILNSLTKGNKGEKTRIINEALLLYFEVQSENK